jgi:hypothetical protein
LGRVGWCRNLLFCNPGCRSTAPPSRRDSKCPSGVARKQKRGRATEEVWEKNGDDGLVGHRDAELVGDAAAAGVAVGVLLALEVDGDVGQVDAIGAVGLEVTEERERKRERERERERGGGINESKRKNQRENHNNNSITNRSDCVL